MEITAVTEDGEEWEVEIDHAPDVCPSCRKSCAPELCYAFIDIKRSPVNLQAVFRCPNRASFSLFIADYCNSSEDPEESLYTFQTARILRYEGLRRIFSSNVQSLSPEFCQIYLEAETAEAHGLRFICGVGYRKALEFLIKDFLIKHALQNQPADQEQVKKGFLGWCIATYINNPRLKAAAERAAWLGNDETHYVRRWPDKDLEDLKRLIDITVNWVDMEMNLEAYMAEMPGKQAAGSP